MMMSKLSCSCSPLVSAEEALSHRLGRICKEAITA
jgi:hypothetical protein